MEVPVGLPLLLTLTFLLHQACCTTNLRQEDPAEPYIGHEVENKERFIDMQQMIHYMYIERSTPMIFKKPGFIKAWKLYSAMPANITLMAVRPIADSYTEFTIVGMNPVQAPDADTAVIPVDPADRIRVEAGDIIAWYYGSNPSLTFARCRYSIGDMIVSRGPLIVGDKPYAQSIKHDCHIYAISAFLDYGSYPKCKTPGMVDDAILKTTATTGYFFEYKCNSGYALASGNLYRACRMDGTLTGTAPVCKGYVGHRGIFKIWNDGTDKTDYMYMERSSAMTFRRPGTVTAWEIYSEFPGKITMIVVRPVQGSDLKFTLIGMNLVTIPNANKSVIPVAPADRIRVEAGDIIAWYYMPGSNPSIKYGKCSSADVSVNFAGPGPFAVDQEVSGTMRERVCTEHSVGAFIDYGIGEQYVGNAAIPHGYTDKDASDNIGVINIERSSSMTFRRPGAIKGWKLSTHREANMTMVVVRPVPGSSTFRIVGGNEIMVPNNPIAFVPVATPDRIHVKPGDVIAWIYGSKPSVPHMICSKDEVEMEMMTVPDWQAPFTLGKEISGEVDYSIPCRTYSISAFMDYASTPPTCVKPGTVANAVLKTAATTGIDVAYECSSGYGLTSGNLGRICMKDGTLSGTPPVCEQYVGHRPAPYTAINTDSNNDDYMLIERSSSMTFDKAGTVKAWKVYSEYGNNITMVVIRRGDNKEKFLVVGKNFLQVPWKSSLLPVAPADRIRVEAGDMIAWYYQAGVKGTIPYGECSSSDVNILDAKGPFTVGEQFFIRVLSKACRKYPVSAFADYGTTRF